MGAMWKADPRPVPAEGPAWPGDDERVTYKGLTVQPHADLELWETWDDRWEIGLASTGETILVLRAERDRAMSIAERLADAKEWTALSRSPFLVGYHLRSAGAAIDCRQPRNGEPDDPRG